MPPSPQGRYWLLTVPQHEFTPWQPPGVAYIRGQLEQGGETGYRHWQLLVAYAKKVRLTVVKSDFGSSAHAELSRSEAADNYVWKEETRIAGTQFELGRRALKRACARDWDAVRDAARDGRFDDIPSDVLVRSYGNLRRLHSDAMQAVGIERVCHCFWGATGTGKSRRAWEEAGTDAYPKDPRSKFWDGYRSQEHVVVDEFRGGIDISHLLRWLDRYPVIVEIKGASTVLKAKTLWITSNLEPSLWYPGLDPDTLAALLRRMNIIEFS